MNSQSLLNHGLGLASQLAWLIPNPWAVGGVMVATSLAEIFLNEGGGTPTVDAIRESAKAIIDHIDELGKQFPTMLEQFHAKESNAQIKAAMDWIKQIDDTLRISNAGKPMPDIPAKTFDFWMSQASVHVGSSSNLDAIANFAMDNATDDYATLSLALTSTLIYTNCCRYISNLAYRYDCQRWQEAPKPKPPVPNPNSGDFCPHFNVIIKNSIERLLAFAVPQIQAINRATLDRQIETDKAAATVRVVPVANSPHFRLDPFISSSEQLLRSGYGCMTSSNAEAAAMLVRSQARANAWHKMTKSGHLSHLPLAVILQLNHTVCLLHQAMKNYCAVLGQPVPEPLSGVYPAALPDVPSTDPGVKPPPPPQPTEAELHRMKMEYMESLRRSDPSSYELRTHRRITTYRW